MCNFSYDYSLLRTENGTATDDDTVRVPAHYMAATHFRFISSIQQRGQPQITSKRRRLVACSSNSTGTSFPVTSSRTCWRRRQLPRNKLAIVTRKLATRQTILTLSRWSESRQLPCNFLVTSWRLTRNICYGEVTGKLVPVEFELVAATVGNDRTNTSTKRQGIKCNVVGILLGVARGAARQLSK